MAQVDDPKHRYRGRLAPSPTGFLHLGHARTFWIAQERARARSGTIILRNEDLDRARCRPEFVSAMTEDLRWFGLVWQEGPGVGGPFAPYAQSQRRHYYREALDRLQRAGVVYPCTCSRQDVLQALQAPHAGEDEPIYPGTCRPPGPIHSQPGVGKLDARSGRVHLSPQQRIGRPNWRFRLPDGQKISFHDGYYGSQEFIAGKDFGDFVVWRQDDVPAYHLAVVVDDAAMQITEVVRGADLLKSTARQLLLYRALGLGTPSFYHCPLLTDEAGNRLAKRHDSRSLRSLSIQGARPDELRNGWGQLAAGMPVG